MIGEPVAAVWKLAWQKCLYRSSVEVAKQRERCSCSSVRIFMAKIPLSRIAGSVALVRSTHTNTNGGSREAEQNALTVRPASVPWLRVVTTVTPVANCPATCRKKSLSIVMYELSFNRRQYCVSVAFV